MNCDIDGVIISKLTRHYDERGWLTELFRQDEVPAEYYPVMSYVSMTRPGIARGPHEHRDQADCFAFIGPSTFRLYLWDNRSDSSTFRKKFTAEYGEGNPALVIVPEGVVHAYRNVGNKDGIVYNAPNRLYAGKNRQEEVDEIRHEDITGSLYTLDD
jgi:dTDP-4-dehydrorhamnose 3,5-epimerase